MSGAADFHLETTGEGRSAVLTGDWTAVQMGPAADRLADSLRREGEVRVDMTRIGRCDTSGAYGVLRAVETSGARDRIVASPGVQQLLTLVSEALKVERTPQPVSRPFYDLMVRIGHGVVDIGANIVDFMVFNGHLLVATGRAIANPRRVRWAAVFALAERAGLDAIPIVAITSFFIGAVVGLLGANLLRQFGAQVFSVELIGIAVLREFDVLITALLLAGRSASSFAAEIGSMKMNQEIDAMRVLGVDPFDALVFPRFAALFLTIPLLVFVACIAGLFGGMMVSITALGLNIEGFLHRLVANVGVTHFWVGMSKAPVMAVVIAGIGCREGLDVGGDVESLGRHVTSAVVQAIFSAILIDAIFALIYMKLDI
ncbi:MAG TPA: ABC transporter permease [Caulobacteraceae bacterium]|jgi:phospholipid/cholesterol/gamma-HCH transport system permease protein|nr:ABC transporter permease [Caulobacteraceae bacterium]